MEKEESNADEYLSDKFERFKSRLSRRKRAKPTLKITQPTTLEEEKIKKDKICKF